ncbi:PTS sugar transporter subunit IIA [Clostridium sp.]|uniref:PTS sugar transporter subunit IIA n=1 Tax=Clostridium sp. TaxID=1506 RepID=UPI002FC59B1E
MLGELVTKDLIKVNEECDDWKDAIGVGVELLENKGVVENRYKDAIISNFKELGPYMVIAPGIVLSHARPEGGVNETGISIVTLKKPLNFGNEQNDPVKLVVTLAAKDNENHMELLAGLMEMFLNAEDLKNVLQASNQNEVYEIMQKYN